MKDEKDKKTWSKTLKRTGITSLALSASMLGSGCQQEVATIPTSSGGVTTVDKVNRDDAEKFLKSELNKIIEAGNDLNKSDEVHFPRPGTYVEVGSLYPTYNSHSVMGGGSTMWGIGASREGNFKRNKDLMDSVKSALESIAENNYIEALLYIGDARDRLPNTDNSTLKKEIDAKLEEPLVNMYKTIEQMSMASRKGTLFKGGNER